MLLGIDLGTGSVKVLLSTLEGNPIAEASVPYSVQSPQPGWAETDPIEWWNAVATAVRQVIAQTHEPIQAIGLSGQMHGVVLSDADGIPLRPAILWADTRSIAELEPYRSLEEPLRQSLANPIVTGMAGVSLLWLRSHEPNLYSSAQWMLQPKDWLRFRLTGTVATEPSDASGTLLYEVAADRWARSILEELNLRSDWLPPLIASNDIAGMLTPEATNHLGLSVAVPVVAGAADTAAAALGSGLIEPGSVQLTIGSGAQLITLRSQPVNDPQLRSHLFRSALPHQWYSLAAIQNAGLALEWVRHLLGMSWEQVYAEAFLVAPGCEGLTFLPYLTGDRTPHLDPTARGAWIGLGLHHSRAHLMRAALEGVAFSIRQGWEILQSIDPALLSSTNSIRLAGGGTLQPVWRQLIADVLQRSLVSFSSLAASARGAALLAGMGLGLYGDRSTLPNQLPAHEIATNPQPIDVRLELAWERFRSLYPCLKSSAEAMNSMNQ